MHWLDETTESPPSRPGPPRLPGLPDIPPMPVASTEVPAPTNKTIEVEPQWLEQVEERRAKAKAIAAKPASPARPVAPVPAATAAARPRIRPIIPREDE